MPKSKTFDVVVIGSGSAGFSAVEAASRQGAKVCLIEKGKLGGECPNDACIPSKALLRAAAAYRSLGSIREFGIDISGRSFDWGRIQAYRQTIVETITGKQGQRYEQLLKKLKVTLIRGEARFTDSHEIEVAGERVVGKTFVVATGSVDVVPPIEGLSMARVWGWKEALNATRQPKSLAIVGGGPVGCEIATFYASFGTRVLLLQSAPVVLHREDEEISQRSQEALETLGVEVVTNAQVQSCLNGGMGAMGLKVKINQQEKVFAVENVVIAVGKRPQVDRLGLDQNTLERSAHIFLAGDVDSGPMFTHTAHHEGWIAGYNAAFMALKRRGTKLKPDERVVPRVTFIDPEVASVGMTQAEVLAKKKSVLVGRYETSVLGRSVTDRGKGGMVKLVADPKTRKLLGAHAICPHAGELIHEAALAISLGARIDALAGMIHAFPTYAEALKGAASQTELLRI